MKIRVNGKEIEAEPQRIESIVNKFTDIHLEDGTIVRVRVEVDTVFRGSDNPDAYIVKCRGNVINVDKSQTDVRRLMDS
jgi:hypothetical protein